MMAPTPVELVRPQPATAKRSMLRVTAAMFCAAIVVAYVVMNSGSSGAGTTSLEQKVAKQQLKLKTIDQIKKEAEMQGKAMAKAEEEKNIQRQKMMGHSEGSSDGHVVVPKMEVPKSDARVIKIADAEGEKEAEANSDEASSWLPNEHSLMGNGRKEAEERDAAWKAEVQAEAKGERKSFEKDQAEIAMRKKAAQSLIHSASASDKKAEIDSKRAAEQMERQMDSEVDEITGVSSGQAQHHAMPHASIGGASHHAISSKDAAAAVKKLMAQGVGNYKPLPHAVHHAPAPHAAAAAAPLKGHHAISSADAAAAVKKLEEQGVGKVKAAAPHPVAAVHHQEEAPARDPDAPASEHTFKAANSKGGHAISMAAAEDAVKKLEARGGVQAQAPHPVAAMHKQAPAAVHAFEAAPSKNGHAISMSAAEAAVKKLEAAGKA